MQTTAASGDNTLLQCAVLQALDGSLSLREGAATLLTVSAPEADADANVLTTAPRADAALVGGAREAAATPEAHDAAVQAGREMGLVRVFLVLRSRSVSPHMRARSHTRTRPPACWWHALAPLPRRCVLSQRAPLAPQPAGARVALCSAATQLVNGVNYALRLGVAAPGSGAAELAAACGDAAPTRAAVVHRSFAGAYTLLSLDGASARA